MLVLAIALGAGTVAADSPAELEADAIAQVDDDLVNDTADAIENRTGIDDRSEPEPEADEEDDQEEALLYQFSNGAEVVDIEFERNTAYVTLRAPSQPVGFWISESVDETGGF
jgi:hypothetical protein